MKDADLTAEKVNEVILVGGMTRMPLVVGTRQLSRRPGSQPEGEPAGATAGANHKDRDTVEGGFKEQS